MWFNSTQREEPYLGLTSAEYFRNKIVPVYRSRKTGAAWLSSARVVRCWVKSRNERNPYLQLPSIRLGTLEILPRLTGRKVGMTSSPHGLYVQGYTRATMGCTKGSDLAGGSQSHKAILSSDWSLQLDSMKLESLVIVDQHATVNTFPGLVHTARHTMRVDCTRSCWGNLRGPGT